MQLRFTELQVKEKKSVDNFRVIEEDERIADIRSVAVRMEVC